MAPRKRSDRAVEIFLTEEDLAAIIAETARSPRGPVPGQGTWSDEEGEAGTAPGETLQAGSPAGPFSPIADRVWRRGVARPGAVDEAIRRILEATTLNQPGPTEEE
jgi:hypothetical protein